MPTSSSSALLSSKFNKRAKNNNNSSAEEPKNPVDQSAPSKTQETSFKMRPQEGSRTSGEAPARLSNGHARKKAVRYRECRKNHAANIGGYAVDGCREFMASGEEGSSGALKCAACSCHRNFHKREVENEGLCDCSSNSTNRK